MNKTNNLLKKLIASNILYTRYMSILSLSDLSLFLVDTNGDILFEFIPSPDFCTYICQENKGGVCPDYKCRLKPSGEDRFVCRYGLENILFPIKVQDKILGYIGGVQTYLEGNEYQKLMIDVQSLQRGKTPELEFIAKSILSLKTVESNKIKVHEQLCGHIAKNISLDLSESVSHADLDAVRLSIEKDILEKKIIDLEAKNMSLMVNPHFLFNTLNCIARIAYFEHSKTEELIYCLSDLLRYNLKQDDQLHTIGAEIDNIKKYLYIQKVRFKNRLVYDSDIPENIKSYRIPNMVIQPIVENALIHGITPKRDGGKISIYAEEYKNEIVISIMDNGNGFPKDVLQNIQQSENKSGLGFWNTDKRLKRYYGEQYGLTIVKSDYSGSTVTITIPTHPVGGVSL
ncbi:histidine kinase [Clostridium tagluense]|uniref:sensor histidine kinase n=1 Tax=Clostridium tagluense TaxID=360422 RepID=UPI001C0AD53C|nr:histidine kinase [Clostridium tagluense]MBU3128278.1 histidine kinase [Clostridium tagluense]MCB2310763.1 histidine kinase [Clostridium tagluense]MCB2315507.1 histidine kinase [Clostridium tagluense]MCB2320360.1 histidine kinase [Clostridium tagluense]MCB2325356.1 histidine kinase [Clostridium tagluense]